MLTVPDLATLLAGLRLAASAASLWALSSLYLSMFGRTRIGLAGLAGAGPFTSLSTGSLWVRPTLDLIALGVSCSSPLSIGRCDR